MMRVVFTYYNMDKPVKRFLDATHLDVVLLDEGRADNFELIHDPNDDTPPFGLPMVMEFRHKMNISEEEYYGSDDDDDDNDDNDDNDRQASSHTPLPRRRDILLKQAAGPFKPKKGEPKDKDGKYWCTDEITSRKYQIEEGQDMDEAKENAGIETDDILATINSCMAKSFY